MFMKNGVKSKACYSLKYKINKLVILLVTSLALIGSLSVIGVLQSTEKVSSSGLVVQPLPLVIPPSTPPLPPPSPPPEPQIEIDVYANPACTQKCSNVVWGSIEVGSSVEQIIYVKNNGDNSVLLMLTTENWDPIEANGPIQLLWDYDGDAINPGDILEVTLTLTVGPSITGIENFNFDIIIIGSFV